MSTHTQAQNRTPRGRGGYRWVAALVGVLGALLLGSCGGDAGFDCGATESCAAGSEYCLIESVNGVETTVTCVALPQGCADCDCAQADAPAQLGGGDACTSMIACMSLNDAITVECQ